MRSEARSLRKVEIEPRSLSGAENPLSLSTLRRKHFAPASKVLGENI
jgi:hypothetical protein